MKLFSANIEDFQTLYINNLQKALDLEQEITESLPDMIEASTDMDLVAAFQTHLEETKGHVAKVEALLQSHTGEAKAETCKAIHALTTEAADTIKDVTDPGIRDIALIYAGQQVEHHEISVYGTLKTWAAQLAFTRDVAVLESIEAEEKKTDALLSKLAARVNRDADVAVPAYR